MLGEFDLGLYGRVGKLRADYDGHAANTSAHGATPSITANAIIRRDASGRAKVEMPAVSADIATKGYVDLAVLGAGTGTVTSVASGAGLTGGPITTSGTLSLAASGVVAGSYSLANITVDTYGRVTAASSGTAVTAVNVTAPITRTVSGTAVTVGVSSASAANPGVITAAEFVRSSSYAWAAGRDAGNYLGSYFSTTSGDYQVLPLLAAEVNRFTVGTSGTNRITNVSGQALRVAIVLSVGARNDDTIGSKLGIRFRVQHYSSTNVFQGTAAQLTLSAYKHGSLTAPWVFGTVIGTALLANNSYLLIEASPVTTATFTQGATSPYDWAASVESVLVTALA